MSKYLNNKYASLEAYTPGEQPQDMQYIKLNTNESPYPPAPEVLDALSSSDIADLRLYSDPDCARLKISLAETYGVEKENISFSTTHTHSGPAIKSAGKCAAIAALMTLDFLCRTSSLVR